MPTSPLHSCTNCWWNGLQGDSIGPSLGYCAEHRKVLRRSDETTCALQLRKDLMLDSALAATVRHQAFYKRRDGVQLLQTREPVENGAYLSHDASSLRDDRVGVACAEYGEYGSTIESLAQLRSLGTYRAEMAMLSLGRAYTYRCYTRFGSWTSGIHLVWWTRQKLESDPNPTPGSVDWRYQAATSLDRQIELATWWLLMLRLVFISDVAAHARQRDAFENLASLPEVAARETDGLSVKKLQRWIRTRGLDLINTYLPESRYKEIARELHRV